jgi:dihydrofolate synthase / folylpolyglutamate synthase
MSTAWGPGGRDRIRPGLDRILQALERTGHPERSFRALQIAGTNGKGSTACFCESILSRILPPPIGLYLSPHLLSPTERIRVGGADILPDALDEEMNAASRVSRTVAEDVGEPLSWFEEMTWAAFDWFRKRGVALAVLETGLGGRWDATSACLPAVSVITNIGLDHREWLGSTLPEVAGEKAGILRDGIPAVFGPLRPSARRVILRVSRQRGCPVWESGRDVTWEGNSRGRVTIRLPGGVSVRNAAPGMRGWFQAGNAGLACAASWIVARSRGVPASRFEEAAREGLAAARMPGRFSALPGARNRGAWVDGGHNPDAAAALARELGPKLRGSRTIALWSMLRDKDPRRFVRGLSPSVDGWVPYSMEQERAAPLSMLEAVLRKSRERWRAASDFPDGWEIAREWAGRTGRVIVCGSLMAAADAYRYRVGSVS